MADVSQSQTINTSQPTVINTSAMAKACPTVLVAHPDDNKLTMTINESDYDEGVHGKIRIPKRAKSKSDSPEGGEAGESGKDEKES